MIAYAYQVISGVSTSQAQVIFSVGARKRVPPQNKLEKKNLLFLSPFAVQNVLIMNTAIFSSFDKYSLTEDI